MSDHALDALVQGRRRRRTRVVAVSVVLAVIAFVAFCWSVAVGDYPIPIERVPSILAGDGTKLETFFVNELRLPRAVAALLVGVALGISGSIFQTLAGNPLASPDIIGITAGASAAAVFVLVFLNTSGTAVLVAALLGGLGSALLIYLLAWRRGITPYRLVLVGIGISTMTAAVTTYLLSRAELYEAREANLWLTGSLNGRGWEQSVPLLISMGVLVPLAVLMVPGLRSLQLSDDTARGLGVRVDRTRTGLILVASALASVATAVAGPVAFVAFAAGPIARRLINGPLAIVTSGLVGGTLVLVADVIARELFAPTDVPVGIVTALVGAPYLLWLLARANRIGRGG